MIKLEKYQRVKYYKKLADERAENGDLLGALGLYRTVYEFDKTDIRGIIDLADCYADMGLLELSNRYWFKFLNIAPKDRQSMAFEELAINFFYMENLWAAGYYFHLKVERDGFISEEGLDEEIINFFSSETIKKEGYYLAYPFNKADYGPVAKSGKRALTSGDAKLAIKQFSKIPAECRTEEISGDYATALFLEKKDDEVIKVCKDSLSRHGENVTALCVLSSLYNDKKDEDKANYYYERALKCYKGDKREGYKLVTCAIERGDDAVAEREMKKILEERSFDDVMNFFYGISKANQGDFEGARKCFSKSYRLDPEDKIYAFYANLAEKFVKDPSVSDAYLPFKYVKALPAKTDKAYKREINAFISGKKLYNDLQNKNNIDILCCELYSEDVKVAKSAAFLLSSVYDNDVREIFNLALIDPDLSNEIKSSIIYLMVVEGEKKQINTVIDNYYASIKPRKTVFENKSDSTVFTSVYAISIAKSLFWGVDDTAKITFNINGIYTCCKDYLKLNELSVDAIAAVNFLLCEFPRFDNENTVFSLFGLEKTEYSAAREFYRFAKELKPFDKAARKKTDEKENNGD